MSSLTHKPVRAINDWSLKNLALVFALTVFAFLIMGYHPGLEDDAFYLAAIKRDLNPSLFPHDSQFFTVQFPATIFDKLIALSTRLTHVPLAWMTLLWQLAAIFFILHGAFRIARRCFAERSAQWAAVTMIAALLTLPISGTAINLADQYLHPRNLATAAILAAIVEVLDSRREECRDQKSHNEDSRGRNRRLWFSAILLAIAFSIHAIMACFGISFCAFLWSLRRRNSVSRGLSSKPTHLVQSAAVLPLCPLWCKPCSGFASLIVAIALPLGWIFEPASDAWRKAASTRGFYYISRWEWYEWLAVFAPLVLIFVFRQILLRKKMPADASTALAQESTGKGVTSVAPQNAQDEVGALAPEDLKLISLVTALLYYGIFQTVIGLAIMLPPSLERLRPFEPMRYLHLLYLIFFLIVGGLLGRYVLKVQAYRWLLLFLPLSLGMFYAQRQMYPASAHIEWPEGKPNNAWLEAFLWIRENTSNDAYFAINPHYMELPGEDYHGFRALAERSVLADYNKDGGMAARVPSLAPRWLKEVTAQNGWHDFPPEDFQRLKNEFGVNWIVLSREDAMYSRAENRPGIACPFANGQLRVCRLY